MSTATQFYSTGHRKHYTTLSYELPNYTNNWEVFVVKYTSHHHHHHHPLGRGQPTLDPYAEAFIAGPLR